MNKKYCKVDCWELEELIRKNNLSDEFCQKSIEKILNIYKGDFLPEEKHHWIEFKRNNLRNKLLLLLDSHSERLINSEDIISAVSFLKKCIMFEKLNENFYLNLMKCQLKQNLHKEADKTYHLYQLTISSYSNIIPSLKIENLHKKITHNGDDFLIKHIDIIKNKSN